MVGGRVRSNWKPAHPVSGDGVNVRFKATSIPAAPEALPRLTTTGANAKAAWPKPHAKTIMNNRPNVRFMIDPARVPCSLLLLVSRSGVTARLQFQIFLDPYKTNLEFVSFLMRNVMWS
jgi:hypothetical protein